MFWLLRNMSREGEQGGRGEVMEGEELGKERGRERRKN
jgi:hypothetical protein